LVIIVVVEDEKDIAVRFRGAGGECGRGESGGVTIRVCSCGCGCGKGLLGHTLLVVYSLFLVKKTQVQIGPDLFAIIPLSSSSSTSSSPLTSRLLLLLSLSLSLSLSLILIRRQGRGVEGRERAEFDVVSPKGIRAVSITVALDIAIVLVIGLLEGLSTVEGVAHPGFLFQAVV
jgi:hypothetical protein